ncbi:MBL fold metallo-hydrolase [Desulfitobacterium metallireducens]|uniref:Beta-lactamase n=1 Tax=Desulfitobacterium metallireducens DSM 15288 TaxID=871968 RepID=W0E9L9_9FIRM|nr:MBL fold metallo-hydrolase [Desulfitobacterium metallireducens]AHF07462.1 beta-lactamase [Desulfitobacterium metallireducens DSM 15288]
MIESGAMGIMGANCYIMSCPETKKAVVIDPGAEGDKIYHWVLEKGYHVEFILLTHGHFDHIGAVEELRNALKAKVGIHAGDADMLTEGRKNLSSISGSLNSSIQTKPADFLLEDGQTILIGNMTVRVIATPGHTLGGVCFLTSEGLISGDTLFQGSIGRTDFPGGSLEQLLDGIKQKLLVLPEETQVFPGHGEATTIGREKRSNPFLV